MDTGIGNPHIRHSLCGGTVATAIYRRICIGGVSRRWFRVGSTRFIALLFDSPKHQQSHFGHFLAGDFDRLEF